MRRIGSSLDYTHERNRDIIRAYRSIVADLDVVDERLTFELLSVAPASRFWVSAERAAVVVSDLIRQRPLPDMNPLRRRMFIEIMRRYIALRKHRPGLPLSHVIGEIVAQPAPEFYLSPRTLAEYVRRIKSGWYGKKY